MGQSQTSALEPARVTASRSRRRFAWITLLAVTGLTMLAILVSLVNLLHHATSGGGKLLIVGTLAIAWLFSNSVYALHYAHLYYRQDEDGEGDVV